MSNGPTAQDDVALQAVLTAIAGLRFGSVEIVIQDGRIVQVNTTEKVRLERRPGR